MELYNERNWDNFNEILPLIRNEIDDWKLIHFIAKNTGGETIEAIAQKLCDSLSMWNGAAFVYNDQEVLMLSHIGKKMDMDVFKRGMVKNFQHYKCEVQLSTLSLQGLSRIEVVLNKKAPPAPAVDLVLKEAVASRSFDDIRKNRRESIIMIVDDDMFMRSLIAKVAKDFGKVIELADGIDFRKTYLSVVPDVVFLDIHMPSGSGFDLLGEIKQEDPNAYIVILSADSITENVIEAKTLGAKWFLAKPFTKEKINQSVLKCQTINKNKVL